MLDTELEKWKIYLSQFSKNENYILSLKPDKGESIWWFLTNLCINPKTLVFAVDNWETNEQIFDDNIFNIKSKAHLVKIKNNISTVLTNFITNNIYKFNIIYLNV